MANVGIAGDWRDVPRMSGREPGMIGLFPLAGLVGLAGVLAASWAGDGPGS
jgi:hypothetical protein